MGDRCNRDCHCGNHRFHRLLLRVLLLYEGKGQNSGRQQHQRRTTAVPSWESVSFVAFIQLNVLPETLEDNTNVEQILAFGS